MSGGWSSEFYQHTAYLMAAARRKGKSPSPTILFGLLPHSGEPLSGGRLRLPQPHGTCSSVQPAVGGARPGLGAASPLIPPPDPQDLSLRGWGGREGGSPREAAAGERPRPSCSREEAGRGRGAGGRSRGGIALPQRRCLWSLRSGCTGVCLEGPGAASCTAGSLPEEPQRLPRGGAPRPPSPGSRDPDAL